MRKIVFGLLACVTLLAVSCETSSTADDDSVYETYSIDKKTAQTEDDARSRG